jgi:hypothetical protein
MGHIGNTKCTRRRLLKASFWEFGHYPSTGRPLGCAIPSEDRGKPSPYYIMRLSELMSFFVSLLSFRYSIQAVKSFTFIVIGISYVRVKAY